MIILQSDRLPSELLCAPHTPEKMNVLLHILTHEYHIKHEYRVKPYPKYDVELLEALMEHMLGSEGKIFGHGDLWEALLDLRVSNIQEVLHVQKQQNESLGSI